MLQLVRENYITRINLDMYVGIALRTFFIYTI